MCKIILVSAYLLCVGHGRRALSRVSDKHSPTSPLGESNDRLKEVDAVQNSRGSASANWLRSSDQVHAKGSLHSLKSLAAALFALNPTTAFNHQGASIPRSNCASSRPVPRHCLSRLRPRSAQPSRSKTARMMDLSTVVGPYLDSLHDHYFATTALQACTLVGTGDACAQLIELSAADRIGATGNSDSNAEDTAYDPMRTLRMAALGTIIAGFGTASWLQFLEHMLPAGSGTCAAACGELPAWSWAPLVHLMVEQGGDLSTLLEANLVVDKAIIDALIWAPIANTAYLFLVPLLEGKSLETVGNIVRERIIPVMQTELATFFPYNLVSFSLVPPLVRPFTTGFVSMCFAIYLSWITHLARPSADEQVTASLKAS